MFKHMADSIKETSEKMFISQSDKDKYAKYSFMKKSDTYDRTKIDEFSDQISNSDITFNGTAYTSTNKSKDGYITNLKITGNTIQSSTNLHDIQHVGEYTEKGKYSVKVNSYGKNLFDMDRFYDQIKHIQGVSRTDRGIKFDCGNGYRPCISVRDLNGVKVIPLDPKKQYVLRGNYNEDIGDLRVRIIFLYSDGSTSHIPATDNYFVCSEPGKEIVGYTVEWRTQVNDGSCIVENIAVYEIEDTVTSDPGYIEFKKDEFEVELSQPLMKIGDLADTIEHKDGVTTITRRTGKMVFGGGALFHTRPEEMTNVIKFTLLMTDNAPEVVDYPKYAATSNRIPFSHGSLSTPENDFEHLLVERRLKNQYVIIFLDKSKLNPYGGDLTLSEKVLAYFRDNNLTLYYQLAKEEVERVETPSMLKSYEGYTMLEVDTEIAPTSISCKMPTTIGDVLTSSHEQVKTLRTRVDDLKHNMINHSSKKEVIRSSIYKANDGYIDNFEIVGKTVYNLGSKLTISAVAGSITKYNVDIISATNKRCEIYFNENVNLAEHENGGWGYIIFRGLEHTDIKPNTEYKVSFDYYSNHAMKRPNVSLRKSDSSIINTVISRQDMSTDQGRASVIITTKSEILPGGCGLFFGLDNSSFKKDQRVVFENISIVEHKTFGDVDIFEVDYDACGTLCSTGDVITIKNSAPNLIDFTNVVGVEGSKLGQLREGLVVNFDSKDSCIVEIDTTVENRNPDAFFVVSPKYNYMGEIVNNEKYLMTWKCEFLEGKELLTSASDANLYTLINSLKGHTGEFRGCSNHVMFQEQNVMVVKPNLAKNNDLMFRIGLNKPGVKIRFYDIKMTPYNESGNNVKNGSDSVTIDLTKYGIVGGLKSLPDGTRDRIIKRNGKYYIEQNTVAITLDGTQNYRMLDVSTGYRVRAWINPKLTNPENVLKPHSTSFNSLMINNVSTSGTTDGGQVLPDYSNININEFCSVDHNANIVLSLDWNKVKSMDEYVAYLKANPVRIICQLAKPKLIELDENLDLISYEGLNTISIKTKGLCPIVKFNVGEGINNTISVLTDKVKKLQHTNNKLDLLTLKSIYNSDISNLEVSLLTARKAINDIDYDLYNLLCKIIKSGNYNIDAIESMIDFFFMIGKLDMELVEILYDMIYSDIY